MDDFFPLIYIPIKKEHTFEQISLYIEDVLLEEIKYEEEEEEKTTIINVL